ncbi:MAG: HIT family protein [Isosphaeraceae bacterium]|jgi:diadenosine tetraphosphate (Ap4A) HIT family hydrolase
MSDLQQSECPFCQLPAGRIADSNAHAVAIADGFPVSPGHTLIIAKRHIACFFELSLVEIMAVYELLCRGRARLDATHKPAGYNVGINIGEAAGQTVMHFHVHLIPRFFGDVIEPQGGVRNIIPGKGVYA